MILNALPMTTSPMASYYYIKTHMGDRISLMIEVFTMVFKNHCEPRTKTGKKFAYDAKASVRLAHVIAT